MGSPTVTGTVRIDLTKVEPDRMRHAVYGLHQVPDGARVVLIVDGLYVEWSVARWMHEHVGRLTFDVQASDPLVVRRWMHVLDTGEIPELGWPA